MYFTDDSLFPDLMQPLIITAAPFGPEWLPGDADIPLSFDGQNRLAWNCRNISIQPRLPPAYSLP